MTYARRVDENHALIGTALRKCGFRVLDLSGFGRNVPDFLIKHGPFWTFVEVKRPKAKLRPGQEKFADEWPVLVIRTVDEVVALRQRIV